MRYKLTILFKNGESLTDSFNSYKSLEGFLIMDSTVESIKVYDNVRQKIVYDNPFLNGYRVKSVNSLAYLDSYFYTALEVKKWFDNECNIPQNWVIEKYKNGKLTIINRYNL